MKPAMSPVGAPFQARTNEAFETSCPPHSRPEGRSYGGAVRASCRLRGVVAAFIGATLLSNPVWAAEGDGNAQESAAAIFRENPKQADPALELARLRNEGVALYESGIALDDALRTFETAFAQSGAAADAFNVATVHFKQNADDTAHQWLDKALGIDPKMPNALYLKGVLAKSQGDLETAKDFWLRAREVAPDDGYLHYQLALIARAERDDQAFLQSLVTALALEPGNTAALYQMSRYYQTSGNREMAKEIWDRFNAVKKQEKFSRKEKSKDPSRLSKPVSAPTEAAAGFALIDIEPRYRLGRVDGCSPRALDRFAVAGEPARERVAVACDDGRLLELSTSGLLASAQLPEGVLDLRMAWLDDHGARALALTSAGLEMAENAAVEGDRQGRSRWRLLLDGAKPPLVLADLDADGDIDIATGGGVAPLTNRSKLQFKQEKLHRDGPLAVLLDGAKAALAADLNQDGLSEILVLREEGLAVAVGSPNGPGEPLNFDQGRGGESLAVGDFDNSGAPDVVVGMPGGVRVFWNLDLRDAPGEARHQDHATPPAASLAVTDYNNDGLLDLAVLAADGRAVLLRGHPGRTFEPLDLGDWPTPAPGARLLATNHDGGPLQDLAYAAEGGLIGAENIAEGAGNALAVFANGVRAAPSGRLTQMEVRRGGRYAYHQAGGGLQHIGIGESDYVEILRLQWTNGFIENKLKIDVQDEPYAFTESERISGSCPSLFVWNGERFDYLTDAFISGPMGVPLDRGVYFPSKDRELLVIPGDRVALRDGLLDLRFTEELHETVYIDRAKLYYVDHLVGTEALPHSRLAPVAPAEDPLYLAAELVPAAQAVGSHGGDLTEILATVDERHADFLVRTPHQGFAEPHWIELTLPKGLDPAEVDALVATGWFYYFESTSMIAEAQRKADGEGANLPWPWIDQFVDGAWKPVAPLGVASGKGKSAVAPLAGKLESRRLRIRSGIAAYWDRIAFSTGQVERPTFAEAPLAESLLRFRGFSTLASRNPERFDYHQVHFQSLWSPMHGRFTAYGPAEGLIDRADGRYAVFGSGDELSLSFRVDAPPPKAGLRRSYLLEFVGYVKDGDRYTGHARRVEPLPYLGLSVYPHPDDERLRAAQTRSPFRDREPLNYTLDTAIHTAISGRSSH